MYMFIENKKHESLDIQLNKLRSKEKYFKQL